MGEQATTAVELTEWERGQLSAHAAGTYLTYASHKLFPHEEQVKQRWKELSDKLAPPQLQMDE